MRAHRANRLAGLWVGAACLGGFTAARADALVAVGLERFIVPVTIALGILVLAALAHLSLALLCKFLPRAKALHLVWVAVGLCWVLATSLRFDGATPPPHWADTAEKPDIVLVTLDTFRADHLTAERTPHLWSLAESGLTFAQAVTTAPLTAPAHASMLTGLDVLEHGLVRNGAQINTPTVVSQLLGAGYHTGAFISAGVLDRRTDLHQGFLHYDDRLTWRQRVAALPIFAGLLRAPLVRYRGGEQTLERARLWWEATPSPRFLWVHLYDAHTPYEPPAAFMPERSVMADAKARDRRDRGTNGFLRRRSNLRVHEQRLLYAAEIRYTDSVVGNLLQTVGPKSVVIVSGDHGESLGEHDYYFNHGANLWEESLRVPLLLRLPQGPRGAQVNALASVALVAPTLLAAAGLASHDAGLLGLHTGILTLPGVLAYTTGQQAGGGKRSRFDAVREARRHQHRDSESGRQLAALRLSGSKLLASPKEPPRFFDLATDPQEAAPLPIPAHLHNENARLTSVVNQAPQAPDDAQLEQLRALGYVD